jgi:putative phosphoribosyl transferase
MDTAAPEGSDVSADRGFRDRADAGRRLAAALGDLAGEDAVVLGLPRGGVPVAYQVARALGAPLDVIVVRKVGVPQHAELAMGAVGEDGATVTNEDVVRAMQVDRRELQAAEDRERAEVDRRVRSLRAERPRVPLLGRTVIVVDDGIATGATARTACRVARAEGAARVVLAVPVAPPSTISALADVADHVVCVLQPRVFGAVGAFYDDFRPTTDAEVMAALTAATQDGEVTVTADGVPLPGRLTVPSGAVGVVVFAHGSGSSRNSARNRHVADVLHRSGLGTLLFDLLTDAEAARRENVFDIRLLARRLTGAVAWVRNRPAAARLPIGLFGASTGAAATLVAAADAGSGIGAVVSRGGRPDLAGARLADVRSPTLLIVGGSDDVVLDLNRAAQKELSCTNRLVVVPGAGHLFEEPGTLDAVADLAAEWFSTHLSATG